MPGPDHLRLGSNFDNQLQAYRRKRLHNPWLVANVLAGIEVEKKYGRTERARRQARRNFLERERRHKIKLAAEIDATMLARFEEDIGRFGVPAELHRLGLRCLGARDLAYDWLSRDEDVTVKRPDREFSPAILERRKALLRRWNDIAAWLGDELTRA